MKKLSLYVFLVLIWCNVGFTKQVLLECKFLSQNDDFWGESQPRDTHSFQYYLLASDMKTLYVKGNREKTKGECALGNCETITKYDNYPKLPLKEESAEHLYFGREWYNKRNLFDNHTINKTNLQLVVYENLVSIEPGLFGNEKEAIVESQTVYQCKEISKFPF
tara:strand:- start:104 stop:595 length:492 start_codon:yes stop_codon:yes gene_type:complete